MFHLTDKRKEGPIVLCYTAFCLLSHLQNKTNYTEQTIIRRIIDKMQLSKIEKEKKTLWMRVDINEEATKILIALKLKEIPNVASTANIQKHFPKQF